MMMGGHSQVKTGSDIPSEVHTLTSTIKGGIAKFLGKSEADFESFDVVGYTTQVVAGTVYHLKISTKPTEHVHARVFQPLPHTNTAASVQVAKVCGVDEALVTLDVE